MQNKAKAIFAVALLVFLIPAASFAILPYSQDFEGLDQTNVAALGDDGWLVFANVFGPDWAYWYGYGVFPAPNDGAAFSAIVIGEGGAMQGDQQMVAFSDYTTLTMATVPTSKPTSSRNGSSVLATSPKPGSSNSTPSSAISKARRRPWRSSRRWIPPTVMPRPISSRRT